MPKRTKHRKTFRLKYEGKAKGNTELHNGTYGLMAMEGAWITSQQIEAARIAMTRYMKRGGKVWIKIFPDKAVSKKPADTRMGSGKGALDHFVAVVKPDRVLFEISGPSEEICMEALRLASHKLSVKTKVVRKETLVEGGESDEK